MSLGLPAGASGALSQDAPAREDWQTEWFSVLPELDELARCTVALLGPPGVERLQTHRVEGGCGCCGVAGGAKERGTLSSCAPASSTRRGWTTS